MGRPRLVLEHRRRGLGPHEQETNVETLVENGSDPARTDASDEPTVRPSGRGPMAGGGTVSVEVALGTRWVGWVGDERAWSGVGFGGRRWWACWREEGDTAARWNGRGYRTRREAVAALVAQVRGGAR